MPRSRSFAKLPSWIPNPETQYNLGMELKSGGDLVGAIAAFRAAVALKPDMEKAHYSLSIALRAQARQVLHKKKWRI